MSKSQRVALRDVRALTRLQGELLEQRSDAAACQQWALRGARRLVPARMAIYSAMDGFMPPKQPVAFESELDGDIDSELEAMIRAWFKRPDKASTQPFMRELMRQSRPCFTYRRTELVDDATWHASEIMQEYFRQYGLDDNVCSIWRVRGTDRIYGIALHQAADDRPFTQRDRTVLHLLQTIMVPLYEQWERERQLTAALTPRLQETLHYLLNDFSERRIAQSMGISPHTVHDHVRKIYQHFEVSSRAELRRAVRGESQSR